MKRNIAVLLILVLVLSIATVEFIYVHKTLHTVEDETTLIQQLLEDEIHTNILENKAIHLQDFWEKQENILCMFIYHQELKEIGDSISILCAQIKDKKYDDA